MNINFLCESRLKQLDKDLHKRYNQSIFVLGNLLEMYRTNFPEYTDHTILHVINIMEFANQLIKPAIFILNAQELYIFLMGVLLHDIGMGIGKEDYKEFLELLDSKEFAEWENKDLRQKTIRELHQELSAAFIHKYWRLFDIPNRQYCYAIEQIARGHRKTNLLNEKEYSPNYWIEESQKKVCLPYLAAILKIADELDISSDRVPSILYKNFKIEDPISKIEFEKHRAIKKIKIEKENVFLFIETEAEEIYKEIIKLCNKVQDTIEEGRYIIKTATVYPFELKRVIMIKGENRIAFDK